jgi:hypothetical protein
MMPAIVPDSKSALPIRCLEQEAVAAPVPAVREGAAADIKIKQATLFPYPFAIHPEVTAEKT